jgi:hypothetical protein
MSIKARREYLIAIKERYKKSSKKHKGLILDEFCEVCNYSRSYAIRILTSTRLPEKLKAGRKSIYGPEVLKHLIALWDLSGCLCSRNFKVAIEHWLDFYKPSSGMSDATEQLLLQISPATIDRHLKLQRQVKQKGKSTTKGSNWIKNNIPLKKLDQKITEPGHIEADTVSHCGDSALGPFISSLTMTDVFSGWTDNRASWTKKIEGVLESLKEIDQALPFDMLAYTADNGTEVLNKEIKHYLQNRQGHRVNPKRGRPYKKNDNCFVEQKNWTHVRSLFGYARLDDKIFVPLMNEIYRVYWNPLQNYFTPTMKLKDKTRIGSKIKKTYYKPQTPYQRLMESESISKRVKYQLQERKKTLNPIYLKQQLDKKLGEFFRLIEIDVQKKIMLEKSAG